MNQFSYVDLIFHLGCLVLFTWNLALSQQNYGRCVTPDNVSGNCINIKECKPYLEILQHNGSKPNYEFLKRAQCGFEGKFPLVCCPRTQRPSGTSAPHFEPTLNLPIHTGPKDVSHHPSLRQFLPQTCGLYTEEKITGGNSASLFEFPWMALLGYNTRSGFDYRCGGSLINTRYVLTAAHCIRTPAGLELVEVRLGEFNQDTEVDCQVDKGCAGPVQDFLVEEAIPHQNYIRTNYRNDIGLVRLNRNAIFTPSVRPICLPIGKELQERSLDGENLIATGWGVTETGTSSNVLLKVKLPAMSLGKCANLYKKLVQITEKQLCAGGIDQRDSCTGDSGGPLQQLGRTPYDDISYIQFGIVSFGPSPCGFQEKPGVYTRVGYYMDWILDNMHL